MVMIQVEVLIAHMGLLLIKVRILTEILIEATRLALG